MELINAIRFDEHVECGSSVCELDARFKTLTGVEPDVEILIYIPQAICYQLC